MFARIGVAYATRKCRRCDFVNPKKQQYATFTSVISKKSNLKYKILNIKTPLNYRCLLLNAVPDINLPTSLTIPQVVLLGMMMFFTEEIVELGLLLASLFSRLVIFLETVQNCRILWSLNFCGH